MVADRDGPVTLSSDFGWPYPAAMRGVIAARTDARLLDVSHAFPRGDVRTAAFWLREILPYFPPATHLAVVDPGVGTDRAVLVARAGEHALVAPDNGLVRPVARRLGDDPTFFVLTDYEAASATFHGRDVFAPLAATIHERGIDALVADGTLERTVDPVDLRLPTADVSADRAHGEVIVVDNFGNAITSIPGTFVREEMGATVAVNDERVRVERSYAQVAAGERLVTIGSHGNVELAENDGRGSEAFDVRVGDAVRIAR